MPDLASPGYLFVGSKGWQSYSGMAADLNTALEPRTQRDGTGSNKQRADRARYDGFADFH
jgi:hypothetical protein